MEHGDFVAAYQRGELRVVVDPKLAARFMSARLLLPFVALPVIGGGIALTLLGWIWTGLGVIAFGMIGPRLIKRSAPHFILTQSLADPTFYADALRAGVLRTE